MQRPLCLLEVTELNCAIAQLECGNSFSINKNTFICPRHPVEDFQWSEDWSGTPRLRLPFSKPHTVSDSVLYRGSDNGKYRGAEAIQNSSADGTHASMARCEGTSVMVNRLHAACSGEAPIPHASCFETNYVTMHVLIANNTPCQSKRRFYPIHSTSVAPAVNHYQSFSIADTTTSVSCTSKATATSGRLTG